MAVCTECDGPAAALGDCYSESIILGCIHVALATCKYCSVERSSANATGTLREDAYVEVRRREYATSEMAEKCTRDSSD